jgi:hypothetical protein
VFIAPVPVGCVFVHEYNAPLALPKSLSTRSMIADA